MMKCEITITCDCCKEKSFQSDDPRIDEHPEDWPEGWEHGSLEFPGYNDLCSECVFALKNS